MQMNRKEIIINRSKTKDEGGVKKVSVTVSW